MPPSPAPCRPALPQVPQPHPKPSPSSPTPPNQPNAIQATRSTAVGRRPRGQSCTHCFALGFENPQQSFGTHMRSMTVIKMPPPLPSKKNAAAGGTKPSLASVTVMGRSSAKADSPKHVARVNGMQNLQPSTPNSVVCPCFCLFPSSFVQFTKLMSLCSTHHAGRSSTGLCI